MSPEGSLDEKLGHVTLNLFAISTLQLDLVEVNAYVKLLWEGSSVSSFCFAFAFHFISSLN